MHRCLAGKAVRISRCQLEPVMRLGAIPGSLMTSRLVHTARALVFSDYGVPSESLHVLNHKVPDAEGANLVLRLVATPVNPADLNQIEGVYPSKPTFSKDLGTPDPVAVGGNEGVFEVVQVGDSTEHGFKVGDWVIPRVASFGTWTTYKNATPEQLINLGPPRGVSPVQAATVSVNPSTAYRMLSDFASMEPQNWFIQNGGNSGVGRMAIQLGKIFGYKSISVVRDRRDIDQLKQELIDLGADYVITEEQIADKSIKHIINDWTGGQGVKLALNCVGGRSATNIARQLAQFGQMVTYGGMSKQPVALPTSLYIFKDIASHGFWLTRWNKEHPESRERMIKELLEMFRSHELRESGVTDHLVEIDEGAADNDLLDAVKDAINKPGKHVIVADTQSK